MANYDMNGVSVTVEGAFTPDPSAGALTINDASFETAVGQLANPFSDPPMTGTLGGWELARTSALEFGPLVPRVGVVASAAATDGARLGYVRFPVVLAGSGTLGQTLADALTPNVSYALHVDVGTAGLAALISDYEIRVFAGATLVASSNDPEFLTLLDLGGGFQEHVIRFATDGSPPAGAVRIELAAQALAGAVSAVAFDHVRLEIEDTSPLMLTATATNDDASHVIEATVSRDADGGNAYAIDSWEEP
jgi:hypothetical protein